MTTERLPGITYDSDGAILGINWERLVEEGLIKCP